MWSRLTKILQFFEEFPGFVGPACLSVHIEPSNPNAIVLRPSKLRACFHRSNRLVTFSCVHVA